MIRNSTQIPNSRPKTDLTDYCAEASREAAKVCGQGRNDTSPTQCKIPSGGKSFDGVKLENGQCFNMRALWRSGASSIPCRSQWFSSVSIAAGFLLRVESDRRRLTARYFQAPHGRTSRKARSELVANVFNHPQLLPLLFHQS